jgi:hypothetical protein
MNINPGLIVFILALMVIMAVGIVLFISFRTCGKSHELNMSENELFFDPDFDEDTGFVTHPYQSVSYEQKLAVIIGASVSYILKEVKAFTMFIVLLSVFALAVYVIIVTIVLGKLTK